MFYCEKCKKLTQSGEKQTKVTIETRHAKYYDKEGRFQGEGPQIVKEVKLCEKCSGSNTLLG